MTKFSFIKKIFCRFTSSRSSSYHATPLLCMATKAPTTMIPCPTSGPSAQRAKTRWWRCRWDADKIMFLLIFPQIQTSWLTVLTLCDCVLQGVRTPILQLSAMQEGDYTFQLTVTDSAAQQDTAQVTVIVQPGKQLDNLKSSFCLYHLSAFEYREKLWGIFG